MRRIIGYEPLMLAVAAVLMTGCSSSSSPELADGRDATEAEYDIVLPDASEAIDLATGERVDASSGPSEDRSAAAGEPERALPGLAAGTDSDEPGGYLIPDAKRARNKSGAAAQPLDLAGADSEASKKNGRKFDRDDPEAPVIGPKIAELHEESPLDNGREDSAKPIPDGQRVAVASKNVEPAASEQGRDPIAKPGADLTNPPKATPATKPAAPNRETLADLSEAIQALDKDGDGQLGVYEWPREKLAEFKTLDANTDGFLTPAELVAGQQKASDAAAAKTEKEPTASSAEKVEDKAKEESAPKNESSKQEDAKAPAADTADKVETKDETKAEAKDETKDEAKEAAKDETKDSSADGADGKDDSSADDQPKQGS